MEFHQTWYRGAPLGVDELIRFWARSAQRQGSKVNELGLNNAIFPRLRNKLKYYLMEFHQTWYRGAPPGVDELIRFWARSAQRQGSKVNELGLNMLFFPVNTKSQKTLGGFSSNLVQGAPLGVDELIRFWARSPNVKGQGSMNLV